MNTFQIYEENGVEYYYDRRELKKAFNAARAEKRLTEESMRGLISDETGIPADTILNHLRPADKKGASNPDSIETVKKYGKCLFGSEYALLKRIPAKQNDPSEERQSDPVKTVFGMLYDILALYESSDCFNRIPGTDDTGGAWSYFEDRLGEVRKALETKCLGKRDSEEYKKLCRIIGETEKFIKSYSVPGVVKRWRKINPQINFFDCAFDMINELGVETAQQMFREGMLEIFPGRYVIKAREMYFAEKAAQNVEGNLQYTETRLFQNELLQTLAMVFEYDFSSGNDPRVT